MDEKTSYNDIASLEACITTRNQFYNEAVYIDNFGRLYRPRKRLTELLLGHEINPQIVEPKVVFDVYIKFSKQKEKEEVQQNEEVRLVLYKKTVNKTDKEAGFDSNEIIIGRINIINWGSYITVNEETGLPRTNASPNFGVVWLDVGIVNNDSHSLTLLRSIKHKDIHIENV